MPPDRSQPPLLKRIERARRVVSLCSQEAIRAYDEEALLSMTCRTLIDVGDYVMAWFGETIAGRDALQPLAHAVAAEETGVRSAEPPWLQNLGRRSPTLRATFEQRPQVVRNIATPNPENPESGPIPEEARAICAFPMQFGPNGSGALTVYAREPNAFAPEEVALLRELAGDIAVGVAGLRARQINDLLEARLEASERRSRRLIEQAPVAIAQFDSTGNVLIANQALADLLGYESPDQITGQSQAELALHLDEDDLNHVLSEIQTGPPYRTFDFEAYRADRTRVCVQVEVRNGNGDDVPVIEAFIRDMTEARAAKLAASRLAAVVDSAEEAIIGIDRHGVVSTWSQGAATLYGFTEDETVGCSLTDLTIPKDRQQEWEAMLETLEGGQNVARFDTTRISKSKQLKEVSVAACPIFDIDGKVVGASMTSHDVSDRKRLETIRKARAQQEEEVAKWQELNRLRSDFMNRASHELNTPLTPVILQVQALRESTGLDAKQQSALALIERNVMRLAELVKDLLTASKLTSSRLELNPVAVDMQDLVAHAVETYAAEARSRDIALRANNAGPMPASVDPDRVMQVLFNLLGNALKYTPSGGSIDIVSTLQDDSFHLTVTDSGLGFPEDKRPLLFSPFGRLHEDVVGAPPGTGLGLFISKGIVEGSGGEIWAESPGVGEGATFGFTVPVEPVRRPGKGITSVKWLDPALEAEATKTAAATATADPAEEPLSPKADQPTHQRGQASAHRP